MHSEAQGLVRRGHLHVDGEAEVGPRNIRLEEGPGVVEAVGGLEAVVACMMRIRCPNNFGLPVLIPETG